MLEQQIKDTYGKESVAVKSKTTQDTLIQAIRMATNKIEKRGGIIGFILNGNFLNASSADGFRLCIEREFSEIYILNLRGNARTQGEERRKEGDGIFDSGSRATVAVCFFVKNPPPSEINNSEINDGHKTAQKPNRAKIHYYAVEDYLSREAKLNILESFRTLAEIPFKNIIPNSKGDWIKQRNSDFETLIPFKKAKDAPRQENPLFMVNSMGLLTGRDAWVYNFSKDILQNSMATCIATYRADCAAFDLKAFEERTRGMPNANKYKALTDQEITTDKTKISWTRSLKNKLIKQADIDDVDPQKIRTALYRPFVKTHVYWDKTWNESQYQLPKIFPEENSYNRAILISLMENRGVCVLMTDTLPDYQTLPNTQVFPLYHYNGEGGREDNISEKGLRVFQNALGAEGISKEDIFYYSYALFHHKTYTETYADDLAKEAPRLPILRDFQAFATLGRQLGDLHCRYEEQTPYANNITIKEENYQVDKIKRDGAKIIYNAFMTLEDIPPKAYDYTMNGKSAIDGFIERYQNTTDKDTLISNDPNAFRGGKYLFDTLCKLITVSLKSVDLIEKINALPYDRVE
ncbi:MAG: hypothetical protein J6P38_03365, partial [Acetobacter sp.]|nr:hypothetical protein [Acetobacter sp.]